LGHRKRKEGRIGSRENVPFTDTVKEELDQDIEKHLGV